MANELSTEDMHAALDALFDEARRRFPEVFRYEPVYWSDVLSAMFRVAQEDSVKAELDTLPLLSGPGVPPPRRGYFRHA